MGQYIPFQYITHSLQQSQSLQTVDVSPVLIMLVSVCYVCSSNKLSIYLTSFLIGNHHWKERCRDIPACFAGNGICSTWHWFSGEGREGHAKQGYMFPLSVTWYCLVKFVIKKIHIHSLCHCSCSCHFVILLAPGTVNRHALLIESNRNYIRAEQGLNNAKIHNPLSAYHLQLTTYHIKNNVI